MSTRDPALERRLQELPPRLRPLEHEPPGSARTRRIETLVLILVGLLLTIATINDVVLNTHVNHRLSADLRTWRAYTGHDYQNVSTEQDVLHFTTTDVACGNTVPGPPKERIQICLQLSGPVVDGRRVVSGGWYLPPRREDVPAERYGCFGAPKAKGDCPR